jgi:hypothetical protein
VPDKKTQMAKFGPGKSVAARMGMGKNEKNDADMKPGWLPG